MKKINLIPIGFLTLICIVFACQSTTETAFTIDDEPYAGIGFSEKQLEINEGESTDFLKITTSKNTFIPVNISIENYENFKQHLTIKDQKGNEGPTFTFPKEENELGLILQAFDDDEYTGDIEITLALTNLEGEGVFLLEQDISQKEKTVKKEVQITIKENEIAPPIANFTTNTHEISEGATEGQIVNINFSKPTPKAGTLTLSFGGTASATDYIVEGLNNGLLSLNYPVNTEEINFTITPVDNDIIEQDKTVEITLSGITNESVLGNKDSYQLTIIEDDIPTEEIILDVTDDALIRGYPGSKNEEYNNGNSNDNWAGRSNDVNAPDSNRRSVLKFNLADIESHPKIATFDINKIVKAEVILTTKDDWSNAENTIGKSTTQELYLLKNDDWDEDSVTAANLPELSADPIATYTANALVGSNKEKHIFDISDTVNNKTNNVISLVLWLANDTQGQRIQYVGKKTSTSDDTPKLKLVVRTDLD